MDGPSPGRACQLNCKLQRKHVSPARPNSASKSLRSRTAYGVTTTRAMIVTGGMVRHVRSLTLGVLAEMDLSQRNESGGGTILIGPDVPRTHIQANVARMGGTPSHMLRFDLADDARLLYRLLRRARRPVEQVS